MTPLQRRVYLFHNKTLLHVFLAAAVLVSCSIILVPLNIESESPSSSHYGVTSLTKSSTKNEKFHASPEEFQQKIEEIKSQKHSVPLSETNNQNDKNEFLDLKDDELSIPDDYEYDEPFTPKSAYHVVFSTGCSTFQDWQSYVFFFHVLQSGQEGHVTRIASGCKEKDAKDLIEIFEREIAVMAPGRFHLHLTPDYSRIKPGLNFKYFNKPFGMRHWMNHSLGYPKNHLVHDDTIVILMDPDQILIRPFTNDFTNSSEIWRLATGYKLKVEHGSPFSQQYGYGLQWLTKVNPARVFRGEKTPVATMQQREAADYYVAMGPPYVATAKDMHAIVSKWAEIVPRVHDEYPHLLAEMFGYNLAAAHLGLKHTVAKSFMVSDVYAGGEGFKLIDAVPAENICENFPKSEYPHVIHYCQRYYIGKWFIGKYKLRKDFISCEAPLLMVPPGDTALKYKTALTPDGKMHALQPTHVKEQAFMVCVMIKALNAAARYFKDHHCDRGSANYEYSYSFHTDMDMPY